MPYIEVVKDIFISCVETNYYQRMSSKIIKTPHTLEQSPYKLHISLPSWDYEQHLDQLKKLISYHLENHAAIVEFKYVSLALLRDQLKKIKKTFAVLGDDLEEGLLIHLQEVETSARRFLESDQFTIYIPKEFDKEKILNLCKDINDYLTIHHASSTNINDVESPIGKYLNFRQTFLLEDFEKISSDNDMQNAIESVTFKHDQEELIKRKLVVAQQQKSPLYYYLSSNLTSLPTLLQAGTKFQMYQPAETVTKARKRHSCKLQ